MKRFINIFVLVLGFFTLTFMSCEAKQTIKEQKNSIQTFKESEKHSEKSKCNFLSLFKKSRTKAIVQQKQDESLLCLHTITLAGDHHDLPHIYAHVCNCSFQKRLCNLSKTYVPYEIHSTLSPPFQSF